MVKQEDDILSLISNYLSSIDGIDEYVIVVEGFPIYWGKNIDQSRAEELSAFGTDIINSVYRFISPQSKDEIFMITIRRNDRLIAVSKSKDILLLFKGHPEIVTKAMINSLLYIEGKRIECPWCGADLTLQVITCPNRKHKLPFGIEKCPFCNIGINSIKCPKCGRLISPDGYKLIYKRSKESLYAGAIFLVGGIASAILGLYALSFSNLIALLTFIASGILFGFSYSALKVKELLKIK